MAYQPEKPTYVIRIFSSRLAEREPLKKSPLYHKIAEYVFDDNDTFPFLIESGPVWFDEKIAEAVINDFSEFRTNVEALVVHCGLGANRSPAIAISLNEIFEFGQDSLSLMRQFDQYNRHVYEVMKRVAHGRV